jgi:hypothetical protein
MVLLALRQVMNHADQRLKGGAAKGKANAEVDYVLFWNGNFF